MSSSAAADYSHLQRIFGSNSVNRSLGLWYGLCAGDRNGGPQRMALRLGESLTTTAATNKAKNGEEEEETETREATGSSFSRALSFFDPADVARRYMAWAYPPLQPCFVPCAQQRFHAQPQPEPYPEEPERAFDTGAVFATVTHGALRALLGPGKTLQDATAVAALQEALLPASETASASNRKIKQAFDNAALEAYQQRQSAGVNPAHRVAVLATANFFSSPDGSTTMLSENDIDTHLAQMAKTETTLTHLHPECVDTSIATVIMCRALIRGESLLQAANRALKHLTEPLTVEVMKRYSDALQGAVNSMMPRDSMLMRPPSPESGGTKKGGPHFQHPTHVGGRSPLVLEAALYFVTTASSFDEALTTSIAFAGGENYCPVLVGSIGGARFGVSGELEPNHHSSSTSTSSSSTRINQGDDVAGVLKENLQHREFVNPTEHRQRVAAIALTLSASWK